jgi:FkbM family methyltransferase
MYASLFVLEQYAYKDFVKIQSGDIFLDCGACCGETSVWALNKGAGKIYAFEPNAQAMEYLKKNVQKYGQNRIVPVLQVGLGSAAGSMDIMTSDGNIGGARLIQTEKGAIPIVTLDDWCLKNQIKPNFIKMDLEGMETAALTGAQNIIKELKPRLAICLYHRLQDMWEIPLLIKQIEPKYKFWCRKNSPFVEFVLYASL